MDSASKGVELMPCPCCGGAARICREHDADGALWVYVQCKTCSLRTAGNWVSAGGDCPIFYQERRDEWNRRHEAMPAGAREAVEPVARSAADAVSEAGVFKGAQGLEGLLKSQEFWDAQPYGTRLYYGRGGADYLHRGVLETAVNLLARPQPAPDMEAARKKFEHWAQRQYPGASTSRCPDGYIGEAGHRTRSMTYGSVQMLWEAWSAALASLGAQEGMS